MSAKPDITVWCDGSYRGTPKKTGGPIGGGFVLRHNETGTKYSYSQTFNNLSDSRRQGSMIAEIRAITAALRKAPKSDHIHVCNDNRNVVRALQVRDLGDRAPQKDGHELRRAFDQAIAAIHDHGYVSFSWRWRNKPVMKMADKLAGLATKLPEPKAA